MIPRPLWTQKIETAWKKRPIVWLSGVRRAGKTTLAGFFNDAIYLNCDLPSVIRRLEDPESFYDSLPPQSLVIFDEAHRTADPGRLLKIGSDAYPGIRILATGSSTLAATKKFSDTLTGRKTHVHLLPVLWPECLDPFSIKDLDRRMLHGGLPEPLLENEKNPSYYAEWLDSFYARDIQELFSVRNRTGFLNLLYLLLRQSGGLAEYTSLAKYCELSRPSVKSYIECMSIAQAVFILPPYHGGGRRELTQRPKIYAFDTGFVTHAKGWESIRDKDRGILWEHLVLDALRFFYHDSTLFFWKDKSGREIDFVINKHDGTADAVECKINPDHFSSGSLEAFRSLYPAGANIVLSPRIKETYTRKHKNLSIQYHSMKSFFPF